MKHHLLRQIRLPQSEFKFGFTKYQGGSESISCQKLGDDCFIFIQGFPPHGQLAAQITEKIASLSYRVMSKMPFYGQAQGRMLGRLFANCAKRLFRTQGDFTGLKSTLTTIFFSSRNWWLNQNGNIYSCSIRNGYVSHIFKDNQTPTYFGQSKKVDMLVTVGDLLPGDIFLLTTQSMINTLGEDHIQGRLLLYLKDRLDLSIISQKLIEDAIDKNKKGTYGILLIQKPLNQTVIISEGQFITQQISRHQPKDSPTQVLQ